MIAVIGSREVIPAADECVEADSITTATQTRRFISKEYKVRLPGARFPAGYRVGEVAAVVMDS